MPRSGRCPSPPDERPGQYPGAGVIPAPDFIGSILNIEWRKNLQRLLQVTLLVFVGGITGAAQASEAYDADLALQKSQAAIGRPVADYALVDSTGKEVMLRDFSGKPVIVSFVFTSCHHVCPLITRHLAEAVLAAQQALGDESFEVLTIGFDSANDTPDAMRTFAREQGIDSGVWHFLSASEDTIRAMTDDLGFSFYPSPRGFDHLNQTSIIDRTGTVYAQVYGAKFELPWLVEPLKELVFDRPASAGHFFSSFVDRVRLFCTVYDPGTGRYEYDRSIFYQAGAGLFVILSVIIFLWRGFRPGRAG